MCSKTEKSIKNVEDEPRDERGRWTAGGSNTGAVLTTEQKQKTLSKVNDLLASGGPTVREISFNDAEREFLSQTVTKNEYTLYRGIGVMTGRVAPDKWAELNSLKEGDELPSYLQKKEYAGPYASFSESKGVANQYAEGTLSIIYKAQVNKDDILVDMRNFRKLGVEAIEKFSDDEDYFKTEKEVIVVEPIKGTIIKIKGGMPRIKSLKAADDTQKERWEEFLDRAEDEGFLTGDEIDELRDRYDEGDISDDDIPLLLDEAIDEIDQDDAEEHRKKLLPLLPLAFSKRAKERDKLQTQFEDKVIRAASEKDSIPEWQQEFKEEIANNILDQRLLGLGTEKDVDTGSAPFLGEVNDAIQFQQARLSRFADERAVRTLTDREWSDAYIAARSAMYSGQGRAEFFKGAETDLPDGSIIYYKAIGDANTCSPCQEADENSPYLPDDEDLPYPGEVCDGHGYCRCEHEIVYDPALAQILLGGKSFVKGGTGSGNFGHQGRPGERGGSSPVSSDKEAYHGTFLSSSIVQKIFKEGLQPGRGFRPENKSYLFVTTNKSSAISYGRDKTYSTIANKVDKELRKEHGDKYAEWVWDSKTNSYLESKKRIDKQLEDARFAIVVLKKEANELFTKDHGGEEYSKKGGIEAHLIDRIEIYKYNDRENSLLETIHNPEYKSLIQKEGFLYVPILLTSEDLGEDENFKTETKGGSGSGNFGHAGRPGEIGGSSSEGSENEIEPHTVQDIYGRDRVVTDWPKEWGIEPGTYTAYRAGGLESPRGIFLAPDRKSAEAYDSNKQGVNTYEVTIKNPIVFQNYIDGMIAATGKTREQILDSRNRAKVVNEWTRAADKKIADYAKRKRYDAVVYTKPPGPAMREINFVGNKDSIKLKDAKSFFQVKGGPGSGRHKEFSTIDRNAQRLREKVPEQELSDKALKAKLAYSPAEKAVQDHAEANEVRLAKGIGGRSLPDNEPMDVHRVVGNSLHGVEVKTMVTNTRDKVEMKRSAVERKVDWAKQHGALLHTVVIDDRRSFGNGKNAHLYSGNRLYYKRGVGAYRIGNMHPVSSHSELKRLMDMKDEELPQKARGLIR